MSGFPDSEMKARLVEATKRIEEGNDTLVKLIEAEEKVERYRQENERLRATLEIIAGSSDRLQALQARAALDNIGAKV